MTTAQKHQRNPPHVPIHDPRRAVVDSGGGDGGGAHAKAGSGPMKSEIDSRGLKWRDNVPPSADTGTHLAAFARLPTLRFSLRSVFGIVTFISVACIALKYAGAMWWTILSGVSLLLFMAVAVAAFVGRDEYRAFAIGFTVCAVTYGVLLFIAGPNELIPYAQARLPTTTLLQPLYRVVVSRKLIDSNTNKEIPNYIPPPQAPGMVGYDGRNVGYFEGGMPGTNYLESPPSEPFMLIGHLLWLDALGTFGGLFACYVYSRKNG